MECLFALFRNRPQRARAASAMAGARKTASPCTNALARTRTRQGTPFRPAPQKHPTASSRPETAPSRGRRTLFIVEWIEHPELRFMPGRQVCGDCYQRLSANDLASVNRCESQGWFHLVLQTGRELSTERCGRKLEQWYPRPQAGDSTPETEPCAARMPHTFLLP